MRDVALVLLFLPLILLAGCSDDATRPPDTEEVPEVPTSLLLTPDSVHFTVLEATREVNVRREEAGDTVEVAGEEWWSADPAVAGVTDGRITAVGPGATEVRVRVAGDTGVARVVVDTAVGVTFASEGIEVVLPPEGDTLTLGLAGGPATLVVPPGAVPESVTVSVRSIAAVSGGPVGALAGGVDLEPTGLAFREPLTLSVPIPAELDPRELVGFTYDGEGTGFHLVPVRVEERVVTLRIPHFSGYGAGDAEAVDCTALGVNPDPPDAARQQIACVLMRAANDPQNFSAADQAEIREAFGYWMDYLAVVLEAAGTSSFGTVLQAQSRLAEWLSWVDALGFTGTLGTARAAGWEALAGALEAVLSTEVVPTLQAVAADHAGLDAAVALWGRWTAQARLVQGVLGEARLESARAHADAALSVAIESAISQRDQACTAEEDKAAKRGLLTSLLNAYALQQLWLQPDAEIPMRTLCGAVLNTVETLEVGPKPVNLEAGQTRQLLAFPLTLLDEPPMDTKPISWTSRDPEVVSVDGTGLLAAEGSGEAYVVAQVDRGIDSARVKVDIPLPVLNFYVGNVPGRTNGAAAVTWATGVDPDSADMSDLDHSLPGCEATGELANGQSWSASSAGPWSSADWEFRVDVSGAEAQLTWGGSTTTAASAPDTVRSWSADGRTWMLNGEVLMEILDPAPEHAYWVVLEWTAAGTASLGDGTSRGWRTELGRASSTNKVMAECMFAEQTLLNLNSQFAGDDAEDSGRVVLGPMWGREQYQSWLSVMGNVWSIGDRDIYGTIQRTGGTASLDAQLRITVTRDDPNGA